MAHPVRFLLAALLAAPLMLPATAAAQDDREAPEDRARVQPHMRGIHPSAERRSVVIFRDDDGHTYRFEIEGDQIHTDDDVEFERDGHTIRFTTPDGETHEIELLDAEDVEAGEADRRVLRFRTPGGEGRVFRFDAPEAFRVPMPDALRRFDADEFGFWRDHEAGPLGMYRFEMEHLLDGLSALSDEERRAMMELERRTAELAAELRQAEDGERAALESELEALLGELFEERGQAREARAQALDERAEALRREAEVLREALRERAEQREALIEQRRRELLGEHGSDW